MTVAEAQRRISSREYAEWIAFANVWPIGEYRADLRAASIGLASMIASGTKRKTGEWSLDDFMVKYGEEPKKQTVEQMHSMFRGWLQANKLLT